MPHRAGDVLGLSAVAGNKLIGMVPLKFWILLTPEQRRGCVLVLASMLVGMVLETLGVGLVIPVLSLITQSDVSVRYPILNSWLDSVGNPSHETLVIAGMLILVGVYAVKTLFLSFLAWFQSRFICEMQIELSERLFVGYLRQPYTFHLQRNSGQLISLVVTETSLFTSTGLGGLMVLLTELLVLLGIAVLLIAVEPIGALLVVSTLGLAGWSFSHLTRDRIFRWGETRQAHESLRIQHLQQGLGGAKDVKLLGREKDFIAQFRMHNAGGARIAQRMATLQALPRLWLELLAVSGLAGLVLVLLAQGKPMEDLLPMLGLFGAAAIRVLPSVGRILGAIQNVRYALPAINTLEREIRLLYEAEQPKSGPLMAFNSTLALDFVSFRYPSTETLALRQVSLCIACGASVGFIGGSGAGKSTLVDIILGLLTPESGAVMIDGIDILTNMRGWQDQIGYVPQSIYLSDDTLRRNVAFGIPAAHIDDQAVWRAIQGAQLDQFVADLPQGLDTVVGERGVRLSGGQRQRIGIARALYHDPKVLVLDEATSSLDTDTERGFMEAVRALKGDKTLLIVAHRLSTVEQCDRIYRLERGKIVEDDVAEAMLKRHSTASNVTSPK